MVYHTALPLTNPAYSSISILYIYIDGFNGNESFNWWTSTCFSILVPKKNIKKKSQVPLRGFTRRRRKPGVWPAPGVVLLEAATFWPWCKFLGLELDQQQLALRLRKDLDTAGLDGFANPIGKSSHCQFIIYVGMLWHVNMHYCPRKKKTSDNEV